jgi:hypothetical protein
MVYCVERDDRHVYCSSPRCIEGLMKLGFRLSDSTQLPQFVRALADALGEKTHDPSDHLS